MTAKPKAVVGMSGGVDSSLTAALLVDQGYDVIGVTLRLSDEGRDYNPDDDRGCCSLEAIEDARRVADIIGAPHYVLNFRNMFKEKVVDYFVREYSNGRTPNPCIACNRFIKFDALLQRAMELGADYVATGHYARIERLADCRFALAKGIDTAKDQSYVLYHLNQHSLRRFLMPLGGYTKAETRKLAEQLALPVADKPDSQEICFIPNDDYKEYLGRVAPKVLKPGNIVDAGGRILGRHNGVPLYTVGQRRGLGIAAKTPLYVIRLDHKKNEVVVGENKDIFASSLLARDLNWILLDELTEPLAVRAKIRYGSAEAAAIVTKAGDYAVRVDFMEPQRAITPGQSVVFYRDDYVLGGGVIVKVLDK